MTLYSEPESETPATPEGLLAEMARLYRYDLSEFEATLWVTQVFNRYPSEAVMRALLAHMGSGGRDSAFMPKFGDILARLAPPLDVSSIVDAVKRFGPYKVPAITDPTLRLAIEKMGGWVRVCSEMPDSSTRSIDFDRYMKRLDAALAQARNAIEVHGAQAPQLACLGKPVPSLGHRERQTAQLAAPEQTKLLPGSVKHAAPEGKPFLANRPRHASVWANRSTQNEH